ncbi:FAD-binding oxidoreductase [Bartonella doshiae]|uniref:6-hydroxy-D-nicotine oxidase n=2 Tax=Bartonella doshiae TaxID=33044 RepID=A0A380ZGT6_BARDO|nr:FAD-dependent oxidoreductase [Bartonella doshiae]EJF79636.1 hypothetical protein MCS_01363 [Bartonella doshiae NCTC 12862 = ATCC 700133]MBB6160081.1 hypothetical protein [Bartonella doshiae]SUV45395.1 6-hydroxy-D-nicotine oxidase [Bartonella doshiae]
MQENIIKAQRRLRDEVDPNNLIFPEEREYENIRLAYNRMHDRRPMAIIQTLDVETLRAVLKIRRELGLNLAVRGRGHHIGGFSTIDNGILIDFSPFRGVQYNWDLDLAIIQPGACLQDIDRQLEVHKRCIPAGTVSDTGITGLTLGGGIGWLVGSAGLTCDYLHSMRILLEDGELIEVNDKSHPGLMSVCRGGGMGGFGLILELRFHTLPLQKITAGSIFFSQKDCVNVLNKLSKSHSKKQYSTVSMAPVLRKIYTGVELSVDLCSFGDDLSELNRLQSIIGGDWSNVKEVAYTDWQSNFDSDFLPPMRGYWKSVHFGSILPNSSVLKEICDKAPSSRCAVMIEFYNQRILQLKAINSCYPLRSSMVGVLVSARWEELSHDNLFISWVKQSANKLAIYGTVGEYSNYSSANETHLIKGYSIDKIKMFYELGQRYDPQQVFAHGHRSRIYKGECLNC